MAEIAHSAPTSTEGPPTKRLRVGTKSCAECRRRKVRCIFKDGWNVCDNCALHGVDCLPQAGAPKAAKRSIGAPVANRSDPTQTGTGHAENQVLHNRIAHLEGLMAQMIQNQTKDHNQFTVQPNVQSLRNYSLEDEDGDADPSNAPLPNLLRDLISMTPIPTGPQPIIAQPTTTLYIPRPPLPTFATLTSIISFSEKFYPIWPTCTFDIPHLQKLVSDQHDFNASILNNTMKSSDHITIAKFYLWIALCLTHYPRDRTQGLNLPGPKRELLRRYTQYASIALGAYADTKGSMDEIDCYSIQWKIYFDTGKPRRAWQILRQGVTAAIQLGLHKDNQKAAIWNPLWQNERQISCMLGLPSCTSNEHPGMRREDLCSTEAIPTVHYKLSLIAGDIINRDQCDVKDNNYAVTVQTDQDLEAVRVLLPPLSMDKDFVTMYKSVVVNVRFYTAQRVLHMPHMLQGVTSSQYRYSFDRAVDASRHSIQILADFRKACEEYMCEVLDFQLFSAAMVLLLAILSQKRKDAGLERDEEVSDWALIGTASRCLRHTVEKLDCSVAKQGADTLDTLAAACREQRRVLDKDFDVVIPYFGRVRLKFPPSFVSAAVNTTTQPPSPNPLASAAGLADGQTVLSGVIQSQNLEQQGSVYPSIEFSTQQSFNNTNFPSFDFSFGEELGVDWSQFAGGELGNMGYDCVQEFPCYSPAPHFNPTSA
ncbi:hypothetical protein CC80DRAFT_479607 [Byssothecium circinans]|uniref:Zn(2)-C6 fungal-type domain-containing protein n=1 Tax=Byssothecium circinans TaxID=147558 RepID=A0A6A5TKX7_9PLEO|nr:hypothetical protein CC80DRAFT_479607 [Byssothecium circinans]